MVEKYLTLTDLQRKDINLVIDYYYSLFDGNLLIIRELDILRQMIGSDNKHLENYNKSDILVKSKYGYPL